MARESKLQSDFLKDLRKLGYKCYKQQMNATTRAGTPDAFIFKEGFWGWIEFKQHKNSKKIRGGALYMLRIETRCIMNLRRWQNETIYSNLFLS